MLSVSGHCIVSLLYQLYEISFNSPSTLVVWSTRDARGWEWVTHRVSWYCGHWWDNANLSGSKVKAQAFPSSKTIRRRTRRVGTLGRLGCRIPVEPPARFSLPQALEVILRLSREAGLSLPVCSCTRSTATAGGQLRVMVRTDIDSFRQRHARTRCQLRMFLHWTSIHRPVDPDH